jgi:hypothetical protein
MKITKSQLKRIIKEEIGRALTEEEVSTNSSEIVANAEDLINSPKAVQTLQQKIKDPKIEAMLAKIVDEMKTEDLQEYLSESKYDPVRNVENIWRYVRAAGLGSTVMTMGVATIVGSAMIPATLIAAVGAGAGLAALALYMASRVPDSEDRTSWDPLTMRSAEVSPF